MLDLDIELPGDEPEQPDSESKLPVFGGDGPPLGIHSDIPVREYHRGPGISKSGLDLLAPPSTPAHYKWEREHPRPPTREQLVGDAFHALLLEPERFPAMYVRSEHADFRTKAAKEWRAEHEAAGRFILRTDSADPERSPSEWELVHRMRDAVMAHPIASALLDSGRVEQSVYWLDPETQRLCKCRPDFWSDAHELLVDIKTTRDASASGFAKSVAQFRYDVQASWYLDGVRHAGEEARAFVFIAIEKTPPYGIGVYTLPQRWREVGRTLYRRDLSIYDQCMATGVFPGYPVQVRELEMPPWADKAKIA